MPLIEFTENGLFCAAGDFYIDPWKPVPRAVITHGHSDHAHAGCGSYLCHTLTRPILQLRLGDNIYQTANWNQPVYINNVSVTLFPAGHIIGSSQVRVEHKGEIWVVSGDYKLEDDGISGAFEPVPCHCFITESTFGLPLYHWQPQEMLFSRMREWIAGNREQGRTSLLLAYSLGKAQRLIKNLAGCTDHILLHGAVYNMQEALAGAGIMFPATERVTADTPKARFHDNLVIAPSSAADSPWIKKMLPVSVGVCSGWMQVRGNTRRRNADAGFALSDHADWSGLISAVKATGASKVYVTHGFQSAFSRYLGELGIEAAEVKTAFGNEEEELPAEIPPHHQNSAS